MGVVSMCGCVSDWRGEMWSVYVGVSVFWRINECEWRMGYMFLCVCVCVPVCPDHDKCRGQRKTYRSNFFPSTMCILEIEFVLSGLEYSVFTC